MGPPRTLVFCTSYFESAAAWEQRYLKWLRHHAALPWREALLCMIDDGSPYTPPAGQARMAPAEGPWPAAPQPVLLARFACRLGRSGLLHYPGWWRSFLHAVVLARHYGCDKIVHIESDAFVLSRRMLAFIEGRRHGWTAFWCPRWRFPETGVQVICADQFPVLERLRHGGPGPLAGQFAEKVLPFTEVVREPHGNRYGEYRHRVPGYADFAAQLQPGHATWFR